jgi:hypothetical protein
LVRAVPYHNSSQTDRDERERFEGRIGEERIRGGGIGEGKIRNGVFERIIL